MSNPREDTDPRLEIIDSRFMTRVFYAFALLAALSVGLSLGGKWLGRLISLSGHTEDVTAREIVIGNNVLRVASNEIRFEEARRDGVAERLDLYLRWPAMAGYSADSRNAFNHAGNSREILFLTIEERVMSRDMSGRLEPIYSTLIEPAGTALPGGLNVHAFTAVSGYRDEELVVGPGSQPFVARCLTAEAGANSLAPCERDIAIGDDLSLAYRFPRSLLTDWRRLEEAIRAKAASYLRTDG